MISASKRVGSRRNGMSLAAGGRGAGRGAGAWTTSRPRQSGTSVVSARTSAVIIARRISTAVPSACLSVSRPFTPQSTTSCG